MLLTTEVEWMFDMHSKEFLTPLNNFCLHSFFLFEKRNAKIMALHFCCQTCWFFCLNFVFLSLLYPEFIHWPPSIHIYGWSPKAWNKWGTVPKRKLPIIVSTRAIIGFAPKDLKPISVNIQRFRERCSVNGVEKTNVREFIANCFLALWPWLLYKMSVCIKLWVAF